MTVRHTSNGHYSNTAFHATPFSLVVFMRMVLIYHQPCLPAFEWHHSLFPHQQHHPTTKEGLCGPSQTGHASGFKHQVSQNQGNWCPLTVSQIKKKHSTFSVQCDSRRVERQTPVAYGKVGKVWTGTFFFISSHARSASWLCKLYRVGLWWFHDKSENPLQQHVKFQVDRSSGRSLISRGLFKSGVVHQKLPFSPFSFPRPLWKFL